MVRTACLLAVDPCEIEARAEIRRRPTIVRLAEQVAIWQRLADEALERGNLDWAAASQEHAALGAHRLGLLEDSLLDIVLDRHIDPSRMIEQIPMSETGRGVLHVG